MTVKNKKIITKDGTEITYKPIKGKPHFIIKIRIDKLREVIYHGFKPF